MPDPLVSVVVPTLNCASFLRECLDSVMSQSFQDFEVVVIDDESTDGTLDILRSYGDRIRVFSRHRERRLPTPELARYEGVVESRGKYCAFIDADDVWCPGRLQKQVEILERDHRYKLCHSYVRVIGEDGHPMHIRHEGLIPPSGSCARALLDHCYISSSSVLVWREVWLECFGVADFDSPLDEWHFYIEIARRYPVFFIPEVLALYRWRMTSDSRSSWRRTPRNVVAMEWSYHRGLWRGVVDRGVMREIMARGAVENCQYWRDRGYANRALWFAVKALQNKPLRGDAWIALAKSLGRMLVKRDA